MKRCFVISPIGVEGSVEREHANDVYDYIIKPAMEQCGIEAYRSDHLKEPGRITEQMFRAILNEDLCIAVLTFFNPNVFYELAVAQAANRPVIVMLEKGNQLPFDIKDVRTVFYDLKPRSLFDQVYVKEIVANVRSFEAQNWNVRGLVSEMVVARDRSVEIIPHGRDFGPPERWRKIVEDAQTRFDIMGIRLGDWRKHKAFPSLLRQKAEAGCSIRILLMDPANPTLRHMINDAVDDPLALIVAGAKRMVRYYLDLAKLNPNLEVRLIRSGSCHFKLAINDLEAVAIHYLYSDRPSASPTIRADAGTPVYEVLRQEFESLWEANAPHRPVRHAPRDVAPAASPDGRRSGSRARCSAPVDR